MKMYKCLVAISFMVLIPAISFGYQIYDGNRLTTGYDLGVDSSGGMHNWFKDSGNEFVMNYPSQTWGAVFITVGKAKRSPQERQFRNFSNFRTLIVSMKGAKGGEMVDIGIKDRTDPPDGSEVKKTVTLTNTYFEYRFELSDFTSANLQNLYVVTEFVFGSNPCKIFVNSIKFE